MAKKPVKDKDPSDKIVRCTIDLEGPTAEHVAAVRADMERVMPGAHFSNADVVRHAVFRWAEALSDGKLTLEQENGET